MSDSLKYFRLGFIGAAVRVETAEYEEGRNIYEKALKKVEGRDAQFIKGFKDGCRLFQRYQGDSCYDEGFMAGKQAFIVACKEKKVYTRN